MQRILIITDAWFPQVNGVVTVLSKMQTLLEGRGYTVSVIQPGLYKTIPLPFYPEIKLSLFPKRRMHRLMAEFAPDAVHIATEGTLGLAARSICMKRGIPFTTSYHTHFQLHLEAWVGGKLLTPIANRMLRWFHRPAQVTMVATETLAEMLTDIGFTHLAVWPLGVDYALFTRNPNPPLVPLPKPVFMYFGRLAPEKGVEEFLQTELPGTKLVIGDGPQRKALESKYGTGATFVGYKTGQDLVNWLSLSDVFVFPSRSETFGLVVVEALAAGLPVAAHDVMGPRDILTTGVTGYLSENLHEAALACLALSPDDCRRAALTYSWEHSADLFLGNLVFIDHNKNA